MLSRDFKTTDLKEFTKVWCEYCQTLCKNSDIADKIQIEIDNTLEEPEPEILISKIEEAIRYSNNNKTSGNEIP